MNTRLYGCWTNKLVSFMCMKEKIDQVLVNCKTLEVSKDLTLADRQKVMVRTKENLLDVYLMLQSLFENDKEGLARRCQVLNASAKEKGIKIEL